MTTAATEAEKLRARIAQASHIGVITHVNPDGDAIGSLLGLTWALRGAGHTATPACTDPVPEPFAFLPGAQEIATALPETIDYLIAVDAASHDRVAFAPQDIQRIVDVNIDHHISNTSFGELNIVAGEAAAASEVLGELLPALGLPLDTTVATCLLTGLVSDTIGFSTSSTTPASLRAAERFIQAGADLNDVYSRALNQRSFASVKLWGEAFASLRREDGLIWARLSLDSKERVGYVGAGDADVTNILRTVRNIEVAIVFVERPDDVVKVSWRSLRGLDVSTIATTFGGGGHAAAAGATLRGTTLDEAEALVLQRTRAALERHRRA